MGRKSKLTTEVQEKICAGIKYGLTYEQSAQLAGIGETTFYRWKQAGEKAKSGKYREFWESLKEANVAARAVHLKNIMSAAMGGRSVEETHRSEKVEVDSDGNEKVVAFERRVIEKKAMPVWQASAWILERRFSDEFGKHIQPKAADETDPLDRWLDDLNEAEKQWGDETLESD